MADADECVTCICIYSLSYLYLHPYLPSCATANVSQCCPANVFICMRTTGSPAACLLYANAFHDYRSPHLPSLTLSLSLSTRQHSTLDSRVAASCFLCFQLFVFICADFVYTFPVPYFYSDECSVVFFKAYQLFIKDSPAKIGAIP